MLAVQEYLRSGKHVDSLAVDLGIRVYRHPELPLVGLKYSQIGSPKLDPIVRDCRGIVLEDGSWDVVAKPFRRFYNAGEDAEAFQRFDWSDFVCSTKEDGSLILVYCYRGEWHVNTSGSFGLGECGFSGRSWREVFWESAYFSRYDLDSDYTYIFEMCTPFNKVIRVYPNPSLFLLSMFRCNPMWESSINFVSAESRRLNVPHVEHHRFSGINCIADFLREKEASDPTFEGVVIRDSRNERYKIKSQTYLGLHHLLDNGNLFNPKRLVPLILSGNADEVLAYMPEAAVAVKECSDRLTAEYSRLSWLWAKVHSIPDQREFAQAVVGETPYSGLLFTLRKQHGLEHCEAKLDRAWRDSADTIVKKLYG